MLFRWLTFIAVFTIPSSAPAALSVEGALTVPSHQLVRLKAAGQAPTSAVHWTVLPADQADVEELDGRLIFAAPPGNYTIICRAVSLSGAKTVSETVRVKVIIYSAGHGPRPPAAPPPAGPAVPHQDKETAEKALCLLRVGSSGCTATIIAPRRPDGRWDVFSAAHCMGMTGRAGSIRLQDGRTLAVTRTWIDRASDGCWLVTDEPIADVPFAFMCKEAPPRGTPVWQAGYGVATKRATRRGAVSSGPDSRGKLFFGYLPASSGDSGGGIFRSDTNELVASMFGTEGGITCGCSCTKALPSRPAPSVELSAPFSHLWRFIP